MKIAGIDPKSLSNEVLLVLLRGDKEIVFRAKGLPDMSEFEALCPNPNLMQAAGGADGLAAAIKGLAATEQERVDRMKVLMKEILTDLDLFDKKGPVDPKKTAALSEDLKQKMALFKKDWMEGTNIDLGETLKFDALQPSQPS